MTPRTIIVALACAAALTACEQGGGGKAVKAGYPDCRSDDLALKLVSDDPATNAIYSFENRSKHICVLKGFPTLAFVGADGRPIEVTVQNMSAAPELSRREPKVVLRPGRKARFAITYGGKPTGGARTCGAFVKVTATPPGSDWGLDVVQSGRVCDGVGVGTFWYDSSETL